jgi:outer membrane immunogenic protein
VTGRLGYASNKWLAYIKGGYANASIDLTSSVTSTGQLTSTSSGRDDGWTVGGGFDYAIYGNFSVGIEYNFTRISIADRNQFVFPGFGGPGTVTDAHADIHAVVARLNYRIAAP